MARATPTIDRAGASLKTRAACRAFTLIEAMIASTIVAIAVIGVAGLMASSAAQSQHSSESATAITLGRQLMEEIASKPLLEPSDGSRTLGPDAGETSRTLYDNVDDYHDYFDTSSAVKTATGDWYSLGNGQVYKRKVKVEYRSGPSGPADAAGNFALVTVTITTPSGNDVVLAQLMVRNRLSM